MGNCSGLFVPKLLYRYRGFYLYRYSAGVSVRIKKSMLREWIIMMSRWPAVGSGAYRPARKAECLVADDGRRGC